MQSAAPNKKPFVILVTSTLGGSGRSLIASALATHLTRFGEVALIGDDLDGRGYFGTLVPQPCTQTIFSPAEEIIAKAANFGYHLNRLRLVELVRSSEPLSERLAAAKPFHQFIVLCAKSTLESTGDFDKVSALAALADLVIPVYRQSERSHYLTNLLLKTAGKSQLSLPVVNFLSNGKEVDLGSHWTKEATTAFAAQFARLLDSGSTRHMTDPETIFHGTAIGYVPALSYGAVNPMFKFSETAVGTPANAISNIAGIVIAAAG